MLVLQLNSTNITCSLPCPTGWFQYLSAFALSPFHHKTSTTNQNADAEAGQVDAFYNEEETILNPQ
jgi:hypothetical protein